MVPQQCVGFSCAAQLRWQIGAAIALVSLVPRVIVVKNVRPFVTLCVDIFGGVLFTLLTQLGPCVWALDAFQMVALG